MMRFTVLSLLAAAAAPLVSAHGYLGAIAVDGKFYEGNPPREFRGPSPIRQVDTINPINGASNGALTCGIGAKNAELVVDVKPGSLLTFRWDGGQGQHWPHSKGGIFTYLASCGSTSCDKFNAAGARWFKVDQFGQTNDPNHWVQQDFMDRRTYSFNLPKNLAPGGYLVRNELISLHLATDANGAEFYPACAQIRVSGAGTARPQNTVTFPGAYNTNDKGILVNVFSNGFKYNPPGPAIEPALAGTNGRITPVTGDKGFWASVAAAAPAGANNPPPASSSNTSPTSSQGQAKPTKAATSEPKPTVKGAAATSGSSSCKLKRANNATAHKPRQLSRIMRRVSHASSE